MRSKHKTHARKERQKKTFFFFGGILAQPAYTPRAKGGPVKDNQSPTILTQPIERTLPEAGKQSVTVLVCDDDGWRLTLVTPGDDLDQLSLLAAGPGRCTILVEDQLFGSCD